MQSTKRRNGVAMTRRQFLGTSLAGASLSAVASKAQQDESGPSPAKLPRWRGFNLLEKFIAERKGPYVERDFEWMAEWGFDFVRLPMDYRCWSTQDDWFTLDETEFDEIAQAVAFGRQHGIHVCLDMHRAPGYSVNPNPPEPVLLWDDAKAQEAFAFQWAHFAQRFKGVPNSAVSFDLVNEPAKVPEDEYVRVAKQAIAAIREVDPDRLIISDGRQWGRVPIEGLIPEKVAQSTRGYEPFRLTHYMASWVNGADTWDKPTWPLVFNGVTWNKDRLRQTTIAPWKTLEAKGIGVHVGEWGAFNRTPHDVTLAWMADVLDLWKEAGWGWALWNLRGSFGVVDSQRADVTYDDWQGRKLDRAMLELLRAH